MNRKDICVSIITVSYNSVHTIEQTILSVLNQTHKNIQYIIIDGGSTDGTVEVIKKYAHQINYWVTEPDKGIYDAMNKGISKAVGDYIGIINSDDWYEPNAVEKILLAVNPEVEIIHGNIMYESDNSFLVRPNLDMSKLKNNMTIYHPSVFIKSDIYRKYGAFNTYYKIAADWDLMLRLYENRCVFCYTNELIAHFRMDGISSSFNIKQIKERIDIRANHNCFSLFSILKDCLIYFFIKINMISIVLKCKKLL